MRAIANPTHKLQGDPVYPVFTEMIFQHHGLRNSDTLVEERSTIGHMVQDIHQLDRVEGPIGKRQVVPI